ncbi:FxDxF family PEP-CTERM protein [Massilia agilis]|uniref:FxDxF family PEP-CTERM protein n=1 Tax=Massilia agilis TaxID=1811226 RepID=A0ABT2D9J3_9BURK|nr:FxDxF family PEP-CTERM protein [Massilia agilis]MCS0807965.1 FxDxF family PEP-CTERM protein [Massilia agilis]
MKKTLLAAIVLATFGTAAMAQTTTGSSVIGLSPQTLTFTDNAGFFGDVLGANNQGATFADKFTFSVSGTTPMSLDAIISSISHTASTGLDITGLALYGTSSSDTGTGTGSGTGSLIASGVMKSSGSADVWTLSANNLMAGNYYIQVSGNMVGTTGASFGGAAQMMAAPVPEPETYGMMLGGLGVLGFLARRRKAKQA